MRRATECILIVSGTLIALVFTVLLVVAGVSRAEVYDIGTASGGGGEHDPLTTFKLHDDFMVYANTGGAGGLSMSASGTGANISASATGVDVNHQGVAAFTTGTTNTGRVGLGHSNAANSFLGTAFSFTAIVYFPVLSSGTERYTADVGAGDNFNTAGSATDRLAFRYSDNLNGGEWQAICREAAVETGTVLDTNVAVVAATWYRLGITVNSAGTDATFFINGVQVASCSSNVPDSNDALSLVNLKIEKSVGTTPTEMILDLIEVEREGFVR